MWGKNKNDGLEAAEQGVVISVDSGQEVESSGPGLAKLKKINVNLEKFRYKEGDIGYRMWLVILTALFVFLNPILVVLLFLRCDVEVRSTLQSSCRK